MTTSAATDDVSGAAVGGRGQVLVAEKLSSDGLALLTAHLDVDVRLGLGPGELEAVVTGYDGLIVRSETKVTAAVLRAGARLKVVARAGVSVDNIDVEAATGRGVLVINSPSGNTVAAAEHTIALLLATARHVGRADAGLKVARLAKGLGMLVRAVDPFASVDMARQAGVELVPELVDLVASVDFLSVHTPLLATTLDLVGEAELRAMKTTAHVLNVAHGGVYNEAALLRALDEGWITGAGLDVFTSEPPAAGSTAARLASHTKVVATPHLGASMVEAQDNVSVDVCKQVVDIMGGGLPTSAFNAPIILAEEHRRLQPMVLLIEKMGRLYAQHFVRAKGGMVGGRRFNLVYYGNLAGVSNTKPLFAALVKGLVASFSDSNVNIVNAGLIAKDKGIVINETHARQARETAYSNLVTLTSAAAAAGDEQVIEGYAADTSIYISRLDRFDAAFRPEGTLIILHNYDRPCKIGGVGTVRGLHGINIHFMQVASLAAAAAVAGEAPSGDNEALMILGVDGDVGSGVLDGLRQADGVLDVSLVATLTAGESEPVLDARARCGFRKMKPHRSVRARAPTHLTYTHARI